MNAQAKHTPGPWRVVDRMSIVSVDGLHVTEVNGYGAMFETREGNAQLISAAPEMAAALLALVDTTNAHCPVDHPAIPLARNILRKAGLLS